MNLPPIKKHSLLALCQMMKQCWCCLTMPTFVMCVCVCADGYLFPIKTTLIMYQIGVIIILTDSIVTTKKKKSNNNNTIIKCYWHLLTSFSLIMLSSCHFSCRFIIKISFHFISFQKQTKTNYCRNIKWMSESSSRYIDRNVSYYYVLKPILFRNTQTHSNTDVGRVIKSKHF